MPYLNHKITDQQELKRLNKTWFGSIFFLFINNSKTYTELIINFMFESNHLYRRIQQKNLFRTFSRTYSRQTPTRNLLSVNKKPITEQTLYSTSSPFIHNNPTNILNQTKLSNFEISSQRVQLKGRTSPIFYRSEGFKIIETPYSSTVNIASLQSENAKAQKYSDNISLNNQTSKIQQRASQKSNLTLHARKQNFKLKSCSQVKQIDFEGEVDESDFSILEYNKRYLMKKQSEQRQAKEIENQSKIGLLKYRFKQAAHSQLKANVGKRIAAHLFNKVYRKKEWLQDSKKKEVAYKSFENL